MLFLRATAFGLGGFLRQLCRFQHVHREGNKLAHGLARRVVLFANTDIWIEDLPGDLHYKTRES